MDIKLEACRFCGEDFQLQVIIVDAKNTGRNIIKCRKCKSQALLEYWNRPESAKKNAPGLVPIDDVEGVAKVLFDSFIIQETWTRLSTWDKYRLAKDFKKSKCYALAEDICKKIGTPLREPISEEKIKEIIRKEIVWLNNNLFSKTEVIHLHTAVVLEGYIAKAIANHFTAPAFKEEKS